MAERAETLRLEGVRKSYGVGTPAELEVLHGIDLRLQQGEFAALIGPSGGGKSTLLNLIGLLDRPTAGRLFVTGQESGVLGDTELTQLRGRSIGFVFQYHYLLPAFTAVENVMMPILAQRGFPDAAMRERAERLLDGVGLTPWRDHMANNLSGGQQQRVAIARALALEPALVLADEPTGNLDAANAREALALIRGACAEDGAALLLVSHDPGVLASFDRHASLAEINEASRSPSTVPRSPSA